MSLGKRTANSYVEGLILLAIVALLIALFWPIFKAGYDRKKAERNATPITTPQQ